jgi:Aerotolerance regulator N-terminal
MFGLDFLFAAALWALPLAGLPVLLHLLFRHKSPIIPFSTLRFVKLSVQRTAARRRIRKWLLLACRALLLALLIWAIAQPAKRLAASALGSGHTVAAAIVIDTSYSMLLQDPQVTLLSKADAAAQDLLRHQFADAKVAIFQSLQTKDHPEQLIDASAVLAGWSPLRPRPTTLPLADRVAAAIALLQSQPADQKWLVIISDFQSKEFSHPLPPFKDGELVLLSCQPTDARSAGITKVTITPRQPIPGISSEAAVEVTGQPGDARAVELNISSADGTPISQTAPTMANLDPTGRATVRFPINLPAQRWIQLTAKLSADDAMLWDNQRTQLVQIPPKQNVTIFSQQPSAAERFVQLALDPSEGRLSDWPLAVKTGGPLSNNTVAVLTRWPNAPTAAALADCARRGGNVVLFLQPGLATTWAALPAAEKTSLAELLPSPPIERAGETICNVAIADANDPLLEGITDQRFQWDSIVVRQLLAFSPEGSTSTILNAAPLDPLPGSRLRGLLFRKPVGAGVCFTMATLPEPPLTNFATHPTFLPLLVRMALSNSAAKAQNVELGEPLTLDLPSETQIQIQGPQHELYRIKSSDGHFLFSDAAEPGIYTWQRISDGQTEALTNVQLPAAESQLSYRPPQTIAPPGPNVVIVSSVDQLQAKIADLNQPQPRWSGPIAIVMFLLCIEALMGSASRLRKPTPSLV